MHFDIYQDSAKQFRWRLVSENGRIIADGSEGYVSKSNVRRAIETFKAAAKEATVETETEGDPQK